MKNQKMFQYITPTKDGKKSPLILTYANNHMHAIQLFAERFDKKIEKDRVVEYIPKEEPKKEEPKKKEDKKEEKKAESSKADTQKNDAPKGESGEKQTDAKESDASADASVKSIDTDSKEQ